MENRINDLCAFLDASHSVYHAQARLREQLEAAGYESLPECRNWQLRSGGKYYVNRGGSALIAFRIPEEDPRGFLMSASHADRPCFKVKENFELTAPITGWRWSVTAASCSSPGWIGRCP